MLSPKTVDFVNTLPELNMTSATSTWPPPNGPTTPRVPRESTIVATYASTTVSAPAALVWSVLLETSKYPTWNGFCPRVTIHSQPQGVDKSDTSLHLNTSFTFHVVMDSAKPDKVTDTQLRVTDISTPEEPSQYIPQDVLDSEEAYASDLGKVYRIAWTTEGTFVARGLRTERFHEIIPLGDGGECEVRTWECQGGILARAVKFYYKDVLIRKFGEWCEDLKMEAERRLGEGGVDG
jgi:uncharacterized protein YndB with AHSA1/START domain